MTVCSTLSRTGAALCALLAVTMTPVIAQTAPAPAAAAAGPAPAPATPAAPTAQIKFTVLNEGTGVSPTDEDVVLLSYFGKLADGTVFDENGQTAFAVSDVVPGFAQGLKRMKKGGAYQVVIPPELGYGAEASGPIPANSTLTFVVMLFDFKSKAEIVALQAQDQAAQGVAGAPAAPTPTPTPTAPH